MKTAEEIRSAFDMRYPDVEDDQFSIECSGFSHEHPLTAIGVVLISSIVLGTSDVNRLAEFTRYDKRFLRAICTNMENSRLWNDGKYHCTGWSSGNLLPRNEQEDSEFWDHIRIAEGSCWTADANSLASEDASSIFWDVKRVN